MHKIAVLVLSLVVASYAQKNDPDYFSATFAGGPTFANGRLWNGMDSDTTRAIFIIALHDSASFSCPVVPAENLKDTHDLCRRMRSGAPIINSEAAAQITEFYKDPANLPLPIIQVYMVALDRLNGAPERKSPRTWKPSATNMPKLGPRGRRNDLLHYGLDGGGPLNVVDNQHIQRSLRGLTIRH